MLPLSAGGAADDSADDSVLLWHPYGLNEAETEAFLQRAAIDAKGDLQLVRESH